MLKAIYQDCKNGIEKKADCTYDYRLNGMTLTEYKKVISSELLNIDSKRSIRREYRYMPSVISPQVQKLNDIKKDLFTKALNKQVKTNEGCNVLLTNDFYCDISENNDWNYYAKSYRYPKIWKTTNFSFDYRKFKLNYRKYIEIDGIVNSQIISKKNISGITLLKAKSIIRKKIWDELHGSIEWTEVNMFIAISGELAYHSEKSLRDAVKGLKRKFNKIADKIVREDTVMTVKKYKNITGACTSGIDNFLIKKGWDRKKTMLVKELLPILKNENAYGWETLEKAIIN